MLGNFYGNSEMKRVMNAVAAGTTTQNGSSVDMTNAESVTFVAALGAITAGALTSLKAQQSSDDGSADDFTDLAGTAVVIADDQDNKIAILTIVRPQKRYVRPVIVRGTQNAVIDSVLSIKGSLKREPSTHDSSSVMANSKVVVSPAEGTA